MDGIKDRTVCFLRQAFNDKRQWISSALVPRPMHSVPWIFVAQSMAPGLAAPASPGMSQNVSPAADLLNLNLHLNKIPGKSTCSLQFEKHSFVALFRATHQPVPFQA